EPAERHAEPIDGRRVVLREEEVGRRELLAGRFKVHLAALQFVGPDLLVRGLLADDAAQAPVHGAREPSGRDRHESRLVAIVGQVRLVAEGSAATEGERAYIGPHRETAGAYDALGRVLRVVNAVDVVRHAARALVERAADPVRPHVEARGVTR